MASIHR